MLHSRPHRCSAFLCAALICLTGIHAGGEEPSGTNGFQRDVVPFLNQYCADCHGGDSPEGAVKLDRYRESSEVQRDFAQWERVLRALEDGLMPPEDSDQPMAEEFELAVKAIQQELANFDCTEPRPGRVTIRRLNRAEYNNTIRDLVGVDFRPADDFPSDDVGEGFDNIGDVLTLPPLLLEKYLSAAEAVVDAARGNEMAAAQMFAGADSIDAKRQKLTDFATRAFRRPASDLEIDRLLGLMKFARDGGASPDLAFDAAYQAILASPHFLFRVESDGERKDKEVVRPLTDFELASRLSYFLWSSMPDERLFQLAKEERLRDPAVLETEVLRMLADPKSSALVDNFFGQWFQLRDLETLNPDQEAFPQFDEALRTAMRRETEIFVEAIIREDRSVLEILSADFTYVNERLARHYGIGGVTGDTFQRVGLTGQRRGVLTHGSVLLLTSNPTRTSPVKRGKWILDNILGEPPPPPPEGVEELEEGEDLGTLRQRLEEHRNNESCAVCHRKMDALGFGLENFDAIGAWRERDGRYDIDPAGVLPGGGEFSGASDLMGILIEHKRDEFCRCFARKMLTYALGRGLTTYDRCSIDEVVDQLAQNQFRFSSLVTAIVKSEPFVSRELGDE